ncbi:MAG: DUF6603 domain-containing protein, partial [Coleofasciculus sp.]|uniref:DUF6603 domain-containing protein n=1 Tax=Coleofasciculus sp. TaxID=3100458 RepID=UPI003A3DFF57
MNKETLLSLLNTHTSNHRLDLPIDSLQSPSVTQQFDAFLASENFILDPVTNQQENGNTISFTGTGGNALFKGMTLTAQFTAGDPVQLVLTAQGGANWKLYNSLPTLQYTLGEALLFDNARLQLASQTIATISTGLWFNGKLNLSSSLGLFLFLIGSTESVFAGQITTLQDGVPIMQLNTSVRSGTNLEFFSLGPITLRLISQAQPPLRDETLAQPRIFFEFTSSIQFTAKGQPRSIPLVASIYNAATSIRVDADLTQGIDAALDEIKALTNSIGLNTLSFGDFKLENIIKLTQLTLYVNPSASTKLTNVALRLKSAKSWDLLKTPSGQPLLRLQEISVTVGLRSPFSVANLSAYLEGRIQIGGGLLILSVAASSSQDITLRGYLDSYSQVTLSDLMHYFLHDSSDRTPSLRIYEFDILVQPSHHYELWASVTDLWSITLSNQKTFSLDSVELRLSYTSANQQTNALMSCFLGIGGAALSMTATYSTTGGWDVKGGLAEGQSIELGNVLADLEYGFEVELPEFLYEIRLDTLSIHFNTTQKVFDFVIGGGLPVEDGWLEVVITVHVQQVADSQGNKHYEFTLSGIAKIAEFQFKLIFLHNSTSNYFLATYYHSQEARSIAVRQLIGNISSNIAQYVPKNIKIDLKDALFAYSKATEGSKFLFGLDISANINLSNLPLVGKEFPPNQTVGVDDLQLLFASKLFDQTDLDAFTPLIPEGVTPLPQLKNPDLTSTGTQQSSIKAGLNVAAQIKFGNTTETLALPVSGTTPPNPDPNQPSPPPSPNTSVSDNTKWFTLQKTFGPVHFERVGIQYQDAALWFLLDAALSAAGLTLSLDGLSIGSPLTKFDPKFNLKGIGIDYRSSSALEIGGAFLRKEIEKDGKKYEEYDGTAIIKTEELTISAIGSYTELNGHPSLFIYATLDYPIGGPAFFFVTGLAAGFGYNRTLKLPPIEQIAQFPLIQEAIRQTPPFPASVGGQGGLGQPDITQKLESLKQYIPPATGEIFLAVGIRFTSFKIIDSFALLTIAFGNRLELNLLGISTLIAPPEA